MCKIVNIDDSRDASDRVRNGAAIEVLRHAFQQDACRLPQDAPGAMQDYYRDGDADERVEQQPSGRRNEESSHDDSERHPGISKIVPKSGTHVQASLRFATEQQRDKVAGKAEERDAEHQQSGQRDRGHDAVSGQSQDGDAHDQQNAGIDKGGQRADAMVSVGARGSSRGNPDDHRVEREEKTGLVDEVMGPITMSPTLLIHHPPASSTRITSAFNAAQSINLRDRVISIVSRMVAEAGKE